MKRMTLYKMVVSHYDGDEKTFLKAARELARDLNGAGEKELSKEINKIIRSNLKINPSYKKTNDFVFTKELKRTLKVIENATKEKLIQKIYLHGRSGTGKTKFSEIIAKRLNVPIKKVSLSKIIDSKLGESIKLLEKIFSSNEKSLIFIDEVDSIASHRTRGNDVFEINRVLNHFLQLLDNLNTHQIVVVATNLGAQIDSAFARRFDISINFDNYLKEDLEKIFLEYQSEFKLHKFPTYSDNLKKLILNSPGFWTPGYIKRVIKTASIWLINNESPKQQVIEILKLIKIGDTNEAIIEQLEANKTPHKIIHYFLGDKK